MPKFLFFFLFLLCSFASFSQNSISIKGKVIDKAGKIPLESVTVYLTSKIDSAVVDYTITNKMGFFDIKLKKSNKPLVLKISYVSYKDFKEDVSSLSSDKDFGTIELEEAIKSLDEVIIKTEIPPIRIKKDTLEFNAASFKVGADANVEALLRQLPGVEITPEGKITVNGKEVNNILVNGKPFFGKDGKIATQNLPAEIIDKVQVVDTKTKSEELSGEGASSEDKTINLTIAEDKNKGFFGRIMAGRGSDDRYESSLLLNYFKGEQKISVLASSNNINSVGFSMNEIFDNMGGGRNTSTYYNDNGSFGINGMQFGGGNGITRSNLVGVNYQDKYFKKLDNTTSYYFSNAENENVNRTQSTNLLPTGTTVTNSNAISNSVANNHNFNTDFEIKIDSLTNLYISPKFMKNVTKSRFSRDRITTNEAFDELNRSNSDDSSERDNTEFETEINFYKRFKKKSRGMSINMNVGVKDNKNNNNTNSATIFADATPDDIRRQNSFERNKQNDFGLEVRFGEPITDSLRLSLTSEIKINSRKETLNTFNFDAVTNDFTDLNDLQSNQIQSKQFTYFPSAGIILGKEKTNGRINIGPEIVTFRTQSNYLGTTTNVDRNYIFPKITSYINHQIGKSKSIYANYNYEVSVPNANQLLPVENLSNPLNTIVGNENLEPTKRHGMYFGFNNYDYASRSGYYIYSGLNSSKDAIVSSTVFDDNFKSITTYENVDKQFSSYAGVNWNKSFKKEKRKLSVGTGISFNYNLNQGLTNAVLFESNEVEINPRVNLTWSIDELITIAPSYRYGYSLTNFKNYVIDKADNFTHNAKIEITTYFPKKLVIGNDFGYTYNSNIAGGFRKDFYLWNTSIGYNFFKDQLLAKVKVYDMLNQNLNTRRTITPTAIIDSENTVLRRYVMFSLTYKLEKFAGKKKSENMYFEE
jgi:hypothetical protein